MKETKMIEVPEELLAAMKNVDNATIVLDKIIHKNGAGYKESIGREIMDLIISSYVYVGERRKISDIFQSVLMARDNGLEEGRYLACLTSEGELVEGCIQKKGNDVFLRGNPGYWKIR